MSKTTSGASPGEALTLFDASPYRNAARMLRERFIVPPFSIFNAADSRWQERKRNWLSLGIESEVGRSVDTYARKDGTDAVTKMIQDIGTTSVFDPVLCELTYRWWAPTGAFVLDPFAGGSVRGIVAAMMGRTYRGIELRGEQVEANRTQAKRLDGLYPGDGPDWATGDSDQELDRWPSDRTVDLIFTCPPYGDLEVYCDDPRDLSNMDALAFEKAYWRIIEKTARKLRDDRFAVFVVGNYRDRRSSMLRDLSGLTIAAFKAAGMDYYAEVVLGAPIGTARLRASATFAQGRKPIRTHQTVLVFVKGDWHRAAAAAEVLPEREGGP